MVPYRIWVHTRKERRVNKISCGRERAVKGLVSFRLTGYDFDASRVTRSDHVLVLGPIAAFGREDV
jgi:hypothetical protein